MCHNVKRIEYLREKNFHSSFLTWSPSRPLEEGLVPREVSCRAIGLEQRIHGLRDGLEPQALVVAFGVLQKEAAHDFEAQNVFVAQEKLLSERAQRLLEVQIHAHGTTTVVDIAVDLLKGWCDRKGRGIPIRIQELHQEHYGVEARLAVKSFINTSQ